MIGLACTLISALGFFLSMGLGGQWALAWVAPAPVLWLAFSDRPRSAPWAAFGAYAIGGASYLEAYSGVMPPGVLALIIGSPALLFATAVGGAGLVYRRLGPVWGILTFPVLWSAFDFLLAFNRGGGAATSPAVSQVDAPMLAQSAAYVGFIGITFLLGLVSAALAGAVRERKLAFALLAVAVFGLNAGLGFWRMSEPQTNALRVALIASNEAAGSVHSDDEGAALGAINAYAAQIARLDGARPDLIVLPENIALIAPAWRGAAQALLASQAQRLHATLVAGFNTPIDGAERNVAWAFGSSANPVVYQKRRLVLGLETRYYTPGAGPAVLPNGIGLEICKDMDFPGMIRSDASLQHPLLWAVPAWDFGADGWAHARVAILRSIENGVPMARAARDGWLSLNDGYGRVAGRVEVRQGFATLVGEAALGSRTPTFYNRIGDLFGWLCVALGAALMGWARISRRR